MFIEMTREDLNRFLYLLAKEYRKLHKHTEIILVGGAAIILGHQFRDTTTDIDAIIQDRSNIKAIVAKLSDRYELGNDWLNDDFKYTSTYSNALIEHSKFYRTFCSCIDVRLVQGSYLIAMKLRALREYKHDISDIIGIIIECNTIDITSIEEAYVTLYNDALNQKELDLLHNIYISDDLDSLYMYVTEKEHENFKYGGQR